MKKIISFVVGALGILMLDRLTKHWALGLATEWVVNKHLSCALVFNRGINWGLLNFPTAWVFYLLTIVIGIVIAALLIMAVGAYKQGKSIVGYILVLTGAFSNFLDRIFYGGVIDFIVIWFGNWSWPAFNVADVAILFGIAFLIKDNFLKK